MWHGQGRESEGQEEAWDMIHRHMHGLEECDECSAIIGAIDQYIIEQAEGRGITEHEMCWLMVKELGLDGKTIEVGQTT